MTGEDENVRFLVPFAILPIIKTGELVFFCNRRVRRVNDEGVGIFSAVVGDVRLYE